jgi:hypothetical protein
MTAATLADPLIDELNGARLKGALIAGAARVLKRREHLNRINVFPVPDGDTGTNLAFTMQSVLGVVRKLRGGDVGSVMAKVAREAVDGARGNSGAILAQFFQGMAEALSSVSANAHELAKAATTAAASARRCIAEPREGTMLSVMTDFASALRQQSDAGVADIGAMFRHSLGRARQSLANTPNLLPVLRAAGVVDAGAAGFVDFLEGVDDFIARGKSALRLDAQAREFSSHAVVHLESVETASSYRYCTECVLSGSGLELERVRAALAGLPLDSMVVAGGKDRVRIHAHLDNPNALFAALAALGEVTQRKADDMHAQARLRAAPVQTVRIVTDSAGDVPGSEAERLGITIVPVRINIGSDDFLDRITMSPRELYQRLRNADSVRTSQPPPGDFRRAYELVMAHAESIVSVSLSSRLSGTFQAAQTAARETSKHIEVVDTYNASAGQGLIALSAAEAALQGGDLATVRAAVDAAMRNTRTFALIRDLSFGVRGGRLPPFAKRIADWFGLTVLIANRNGFVKPFYALMGKKRLIERFADVVAKRMPPGAACRATVGHCDASDDAATLAAALRDRIPGLTKLWVVETGPAIGVHAGPGSLVVGIQQL